MGKNKRGKGRGKQQRGVLYPPPTEEQFARPAPGVFRGPAPVRPMGLPGPRFFPPQPPRMTMMRDERMFMDDRPGFHPFDEPFLNRPPERFFDEFGGGHPDFCPPEFRGRPPEFYPGDGPGFRMMDPELESRFGPNYVPPMDGGHPFGLPDYQGPAPVQPPQAFNTANIAQPRNAFPPPPTQPQQDKVAPQSTKETETPKSSETKPEPSKTVTSKSFTFTNVTKPPRGRSLGVITFIGNSCGFIERDDLKKYSFIFNVFYGKRAHLVPGVKVHFTVVKTLGREVATDVKVAPGGTEDIDNTVYEGVVTTALSAVNEETNSGRIRTIISVDPINLPFGKADTSVTLLLYDRVEFNLVTNVITKEQRVINIKPKIPDTFVLTKEVRETGLVIKKSNETLTVKCKNNDELTASPADRLSEDELNVNDDVEFTIMAVNEKKHAIRLKKLSSDIITQAKTEISHGTPVKPPAKDKWKPVTMEAGLVVSSEKHEGTVINVAPNETDKQDAALGSLVVTLEGTEKRLSFRSGDVITKATMMVGDKVRFNISTNTITREESAVNLEILPESFQTDSTGQRKTGLVFKLDEKSGFIKTVQYPHLFFYLSEVMEETKLCLFEKVEFSVSPYTAAVGGKQAVRIRRANGNVFTSAPKVEPAGVKDKKKMTIKLMERSIEEVKTEDKDCESKTAIEPNVGKNQTSSSATLMGELKKERDKQDKPKPKDDRAQDRSRDSSRRRSRSRSRETERRRHSRSRSRDKGSRRYRSSSREKRDHRYRRSRSRERHRRSASRSRSRERSHRSAKRRSRSPENRDDRHKKQTSGKESSSKKRTKSPEGEVNDELSRKRKELMELDELIARKKAIVAMEQNFKKYEVEVDGEHGVKTFDYQHARCENLWTPDAKPVKSILKKQTELHADPHLQASTSKETAPFASADSQRFSPFDTSAPVYSTQKSNTKESLTVAASKDIPLSQFKDPELLRKKRELDELSESIARKRALIALEQKNRGISNASVVERQFDLDIETDEQFKLTQEKGWDFDAKSCVQPKKSILKKRTEPLSFQCDSPTADEYGEVRPSQDDSAFSKQSFQTTAGSLFRTSVNPNPTRSNTLGLFNKVLSDSSATLRVTEPSPFIKPAVVQKSLPLTSNPNLLDVLQRSSMSKGSSSNEDQHRVISPRDHPHNASPSTSHASSSEPKSNVTTQMERFLSALNKADSSILNSLFQEASKSSDLTSIKKPHQSQLDKKIPFMDDIYDPFEEDNDNDERTPVRIEVGRHSLQKRVKSPMATETQLEDPSQDDLLPHERALQDGSDYSWLVGTKYDVQSTVNTERKLPYSQQNASPIQTIQRVETSWFSGKYEPQDEDDNLYVTQQKDYSSDPNMYSESSQLASVNVNVQDREMPDSRFSKNVVRQQSEESNKGIDEKKESFEKLQSLLQTIGLDLDTGEVSKLADRTRERLYGKTLKRQDSSSHSLEVSVSRSEREGSSRADSSDKDGFRSASPTQSSNRRVYMSYRDSVKDRDQQKVENMDLTSIKRTIINPKSSEETQDACSPSTKQTTVSPVSYQPESVLPTAVAGSSQCAPPVSTIPTFPPSQYSYYNNEQNPWSAPYSSGSINNANVQYSAFPYGTLHPPPNYAGYQAASPTMPYSPYNSQTVNPYTYSTPPMPVPYGPPIAQPSNIVPLTQPTRCLKTIQTVEVKSGTVEAKPVSNRVLSSIKLQIMPKVQVAVQEEAGRNQMTALTEDDIKAKQKKRLEQFNQRMKLKKEQQMEAQRARGQKPSSTPGKTTPNQIKNVWICGHSLVFWAEKRTTSPEFGMQLGMQPDSVRIWWKGVQGMTWKQLLPLLHQLKDNWPKPDLLIIHLGGNDISTIDPDTFTETVEKDLSSLKSIFPECLLVWSDILARNSWRDEKDSQKMDLSRMAINEGIHQVMFKLGGSVVSHNNLLPRLGLYRPDGIHLSGKGIDTFNLNLQDFLEKWESENEKTSI